MALLPVWPPKEDKAIPVMLGPKHSRLYYLNSRNRIAGTDDSNLAHSIEIPSTIEFDSVVLLDVVIPKSYYLVQAGYNTFTLRELGVNITVTVPVGNYSVTSFQTVIAALLTAASTHVWTYTVTYPNARITADTGK